MKGLVNRYKDIGNEIKRFRGVFYREAVEQGIDNLLNTVRGERLFRPDFGSVLDSIIFDPVHEYTKYGVITALHTTLRQEERIELLNIDVELYPEQHSLKVVVEYRITGFTEPYIYMRKITL